MPGPYQITALTVEAINDVLRRIQEDNDALKRQSLFRVSFVHENSGIAVSNPGTSYAEVDAGLRQQIDFARQTVAQVRVIVRGSGNETTSPKGVAIADANGKTICEVIWGGSAAGTQVGSWTTCTLTADALLRLYAKGSSGTEDLTLNSVVMECRATVVPSAA